MNVNDSNGKRRPGRTMHSGSEKPVHPVASSLATDIDTEDEENKPLPSIVILYYNAVGTFYFMLLHSGDCDRVPFRLSHIPEWVFQPPAISTQDNYVLALHKSQPQDTRATYSEGAVAVKPPKVRSHERAYEAVKAGSCHKGGLRLKARSSYAYGIDARYRLL